ncbi:MAG TPA: hypothetical protein VM597_13745 [Gemmataceae bacterium]|jgi:hypothetical protein|nr:hypothetical protein [Gemmataceae bacterium]
MDAHVRRIKEAQRRREEDAVRALSLYDDVVFRWRVAADGHRWVETNTMTEGGERGPKTTLLTNDVGVGQIARVREYTPLRTNKGLFLEFIQTEVSRDGIKRFADHWGMLEGDSIVFPDPGGGIAIGESFKLWRDSILTMSRAVRLWLAARANDAAELGRLITWQEKGENRVEGWIFFEEIKWGDGGIGHHGEFLDPTVFDHVKSSDRSAAALSFVQLWINQHLKPRTETRVLWNRDRREFCIRIVPSSLLGVLWWQFARAFVGEVSYQQCGVCKRPMEIGSGAFRVDRAFCSAACRQKDHRSKVKEAKAMKAAGRTLRQIAKHFETDVSVIENWISKRK